jgi:hypothetical protein
MVDTTPEGRPTAIVRAGRRYEVQTRFGWDARVYRVVVMPAGTGVAEIARRGDDWRLRHWWTS